MIQPWRKPFTQHYYSFQTALRNKKDTTWLLYLPACRTFDTGVLAKQRPFGTSLVWVQRIVLWMTNNTMTAVQLKTVDIISTWTYVHHGDEDNVRCWWQKWWQRWSGYDCDYDDPDKDDNNDDNDNDDDDDNDFFDDDNDTMSMISMITMMMMMTLTMTMTMTTVIMITMASMTSNRL